MKVTVSEGEAVWTSALLLVIGVTPVLRLRQRANLPRYLQYSSAMLMPGKD